MHERLRRCSVRLFVGSVSRPAWVSGVWPTASFLRRARTWGERSQVWMLPTRSAAQSSATRRSPMSVATFSSADRADGRPPVPGYSVPTSFRDGVRLSCATAVPTSADQIHSR